MNRGKYIAILAATLATLGGCDGAVSEATGELGVLELPLKTSDPTGGSWHLADAVLTVRDADGETVETFDDPNATVVRTPLSPGDYSVELDEGWHLYRVLGGVETLVEAEVVENPIAFTINPSAPTAVTFHFRLIKDGSLSVGFAVDNANPKLNVSLTVTSASGPWSGLESAAFSLAFDAVAQHRILWTTYAEDSLRGTDTTLSFDPGSPPALGEWMADIDVDIPGFSDPDPYFRLVLDRAPGSTPYLEYFEAHWLRAGSYVCQLVLTPTTPVVVASEEEFPVIAPFAETAGDFHMDCIAPGGTPVGAIEADATFYVE